MTRPVQRVRAPV